MVRYRLIISGEVQGVTFRLSACVEAKRHDLFGWIMNRRDGRVECVIQGEEEQCKQFIAWSRIGPERARVATCTVQEESIHELYKNFRVRYASLFGIPR